MTKKSFKNLGHNLFSLLDSENIDKEIRNSIIFRTYYDLLQKEKYENNKTIQEIIEKVENELIHNKDCKNLNYEQKHKKLFQIMGRYINDDSIGEAFPRGRYGMYDNFDVDTDILMVLANSIREGGVKNTYRYGIELKSVKDNIGRIIFPDLNSIIYVNENGNSRTFTVLNSLKGFAFTLEQKSGDTIVGRDMCENDYKEPINYIYFNNGEYSIVYSQNGEQKQLKQENGLFYTLKNQFKESDILEH